jgi:hypothetical protein
MHDSPASTHLAHLPSPPSELRAWLLACSICVVGLAVLVAVLTGAVGRTTAPAPPPVVVAPTPVPGPSAAASALAGATRPGLSGTAAAPAGASHRAAAQPSSQQTLDAARSAAATEAHVAGSWVAGFYPIYATAQGTFAVNWLLLASIHMQETAFSTARSTYRGLNFAHCCGGPMQFNVTNGPVTTWDLVSNSYRYGRRPARYDHPTPTHPSIYDDFDAIMAAGHLLSADGAGAALDGSAWDAAYAYYGHDANGVVYADQVLARAIGWSQHGFCINCPVELGMIDAVHGAYGAPVLAALARTPPPRTRPAPARRRAKSRTTGRPGAAPTPARR